MTNPIGKFPKPGEFDVVREWGKLHDPETPWQISLRTLEFRIRADQRERDAKICERVRTDHVFATTVKACAAAIRSQE